MSDKPDKGRVLVRAGVDTGAKAKGRTTPELKQRIRDAVECAIVNVTEIAKRQHMEPTDVEMLAKLNKLLTDLDQVTVAPEEMTEEELAVRAGRK